MSAREWLWHRTTELMGASCVAAVLIGGLWVGIPFLRARIAEVFFYSAACLGAIILRSVIDLFVRGGLRVAYGLRRLIAPQLGPVSEAPSPV